MSRQIATIEENEKLVVDKFCVATQDIHVVIRIRLLDQNSITTLSKSVMTESKKKLREQVATENCKLRQKPAIKTEDFVVTVLSMSRQSDEFDLEI